MAQPLLQYGKRVLRKALKAIGYELHAIGTTPKWAFVLDGLRKRGFDPRTVIDIGVAQGTPELYAAFPRAHYILVDPLRESLPYMNAIAEQFDAQVLNIGLGEEDDELIMKVRQDDIAGSSLYEEIGPLGRTVSYPVQIRRFDEAIGSFLRAALCKIDVQGAELAVLKGMGSRLEEIDAFIIECNVIATVKDAPELFEICSFLHQRKYAIYDILSTLRRPLDGALAQIDLLFVKELSPLRMDRRWRSVCV